MADGAIGLAREAGAEAARVAPYGTSGGIFQVGPVRIGRRGPAGRRLPTPLRVAGWTLAAVAAGACGGVSRAAESASAPVIATSAGVVADGAVGHGVLWFTLSGADLRFSAPTASLPQPEAFFAALKMSAGATRSIIVHYRLDSGSIYGPTSAATFAPQDIVYDGHAIAGVTPSGSAGPPAELHEAALARAIALTDTGDDAGARTALNDAQAGGVLTPALRILALKTRAAADEHEATADHPPGPDRDRLLVAVLADARRWSQADPDDPQACYRLAGALRDLGAYDAALAEYQAIGSRWPDEWFWSTIRIAATRRIMGDYPQALKILDEMDRLHDVKTTMPFHYHRGWTLRLMGRMAEATREFTAGIAVQPDFHGAFMQRACVLARQGRIGDALADLQTALALQKTYAEGRPVTPALQMNEAWGAAVLADLRSAAAASPARPVDAPCHGYWDEGEGRRERSALIDAVGAPAGL